MPQSLLQSHQVISRKWYALYTKSRHEKHVNSQLQEKNIESYLPVRKVLRQWSDRKKWMEQPLFSSYIFVHATDKERLIALQTYGSVRFVGFNNRAVPVRESEISMIRRILKEQPDVESCNPLNVGDRIEIVQGPLIGIQGNLEEIRNTQRVVVSIDSIGRAMRFNIDRSEIRVLADH